MRGSRKEEHGHVCCRERERPRWGARTLKSRLRGTIQNILFFRHALRVASTAGGGLALRLPARAFMPSKQHTPSLPALRLFDRGALA